MSKQEEDFLLVLEQHRGILFKIVNAYCKDEEDRKDLAQEILIQLWSSIDRFDERVKFSTWMYRVSLNVAISFHRKKNVRNTEVLDDSFLQIAEDTSDQSEELQLLNKFIHELDDLNRALIILYLDGNNHNEIAEVLSISKSNVGTKISRIKNLLRDKFKTID